jgi:hypothetical protein
VSRECWVTGSGQPPKHRADSIAPRRLMVNPFD